MHAQTRSPESRTASDESPRPRRFVYQPLVIVCAAMVAGIVFDRYCPSPHRAGASMAYWLAAITALGAWAMLFRRVAKPNAMEAVPLLIAVALAGAAWHHARWNVFGVDEIGLYAADDSRPVCVRAIAAHAPQRLPAAPPNPLRAIVSGERSELLISIRAIRVGRTWRPASGACQLTVAGHLLGVQAGDRLEVFARLVAPSAAMNPGAFDFREYARADRALCVMQTNFPDCVAMTPAPEPASLQRRVDGIRWWGDRMLSRYVGNERSDLAAAITLGAREGLPTESTEHYLATGTVHLLVVSGLHVGILAMGLFFLQRAGLARRGVALVAAIVLVSMYALVADARPPVIRAAVLTILVCVALWTGRRAVRYNSLAAAAIIVLAVNPADLFRTGPQLSFLSVGSLIWYGHRFVMDRSIDPLDRLIASARPWPVRAIFFVGNWTRHVMLGTLVVWSIALPLVLNRFHIFAPVTVFISPIVWVLTYVALTTGFLLLFVGWIVPIIAQILGAACNASLYLLETTVNASQRTPFGHSWWPGPEAWWVAGFYVAIVTAVVCQRVRIPRRWALASLSIWVIAGLVVPLSRNVGSNPLTCSFVSVGHGACVVLQTPSGETLLYDAGSLGSPYQSARSVAAFLWSQGVTRIDSVIVSHSDIDHFNAIPDLIPRFAFGGAFVSPVMFDPILVDESASQMNAPDFLRQTFDGVNIPLRVIQAGDELTSRDSNVRIEVLHPPERGVLGSDNANSIVLLVEYAGKKILLPGDLESPGLDDVLAESPIDCDIVLAPHHGSGGSDPPGFAKWCSPNWVVISGGRDSIDGIAATAFRAAGAEVLHTAVDGAVQFEVDSNGVRARSWKNNW